MRAWVVVAALISSIAPARAAPRAVTLYLDRDGDSDVPRFGGGDRTWSSIVACVERQFAPFQVDVVDDEPAHGSYITVVVGGRASALGYSRSTDGVGPYRGRVIRDAVVHVFSRTIGERDATGVCDVVAHEAGHALGLEHVIECSDLMSYDDSCRSRSFLDVDSSCGDRHARSCESGDDTQNSYRRLAALVGLRDQGGRRARRRR